LQWLSEVIYLINTGGNQPQFFQSTHFFYHYLPFTGGAAVMLGFYIQNFLGLPTAEISGALLIAMLIESPGHIGSDAGIK
jgi:hypothetical protein